MTAAYVALVRGLVTRGRVVAMLALGIVTMLLGIAVRTAEPWERADAAFDVITTVGIALLVPVVALVFASAALGDPAEDGTLVYLWLRPVPRWRLAVAAFAASLTVCIPLGVAPVIVAAALTGIGGSFVLGTSISAAVAAVSYSALFCGLGLRVRRALAWGLAYVFIWEGAVARTTSGAAKLAVGSYARTLLAEIGELPPPRFPSSTFAAFAVPLGAAAIAVVLTARSLRRGDVA